MRPLALAFAATACLLGSLVPVASAQAGGSFNVSLQADSRSLAPLLVEFSAQVPADVSVRWDFGDGGNGQGTAVSHTYYRAGTYTATVILSRGGREVGRSSLPVAVRSQGAEKAGLVVLFGRGTVSFSDVGSVVYGPYQPRFTLDGQSLGAESSVALRPGAHTAAVQIKGSSGTLNRTLHFTVPAGQFLSSATYEDQVMKAVNTLRTNRYNCATGRTDGVARPPLTRSATLDRAALAQAIAMPVGGFVEHVSLLDGSTPAQRIAAAGYPNASTAENLAAGQPTPAEAVDGWLNSSGHCAALMGDYSETGLSYVRVPGSDYEHYWVQVFGKRVE